MVSYKAEVTLNEKDAVCDMLALEKQIVKVYASALTEGVSKGFRSLAEKHLSESAKSQLKTFFMLTERGYDKVESASEELKKSVLEKYGKEKSKLY